MYNCWSFVVAPPKSSGDKTANIKLKRVGTRDPVFLDPLEVFIEFFDYGEVKLNIKFKEGCWNFAAKGVHASWKKSKSSKVLPNFLF